MTSKSSRKRLGKRVDLLPWPCVARSYGVYASRMLTVHARCSRRDPRKLFPRGMRDTREHILKSAGPLSNSMGRGARRRLMSPKGLALNVTSLRPAPPFFLTF